MSELAVTFLGADAFELEHDGRRERVGFHEYDRIYAVPGLYEELFYRRLSCRSPQEVVAALADALAAVDVAPAGLRVLDLGAGNGIVAEQLRALGVGAVVGLDVEPRAAEAARRDRPGAYDDYLVADLLLPEPALLDELRARGLNALTAVAALGFGHVPADVFARALDVLAPGAWVACSMAPELLEAPGEDPFGRLVGSLLESGALEERLRRPFVHRRGVDGTALPAVALIARVG